MHTFFDRIRLFFWGRPPRLPFFLCWLIGAAALLCVSFLYRCAFAISCWWHSKSPYRSPFTVISVGNLTVGGTGKSVAVRHFLTLLGEQNCAVVMRGYGGQAARQKKPICVAAGGRVLSTASEAGDEAYALALHTQALVVVGGDKRASVAWCARQTQQKITYIILDDGYQSWTIARDSNIVLIDGRAPLGNGYCLPMGPLRERDLTRATGVMVTHAASLSRCERLVLEKLVHSLAQKALPIEWTSHEPEGVFMRNDVADCVDLKKHKDVFLVVGVGSPKGVQTTLLSLGATIVDTFVFPDHHVYTKEEVATVVKKTAGHLVITTEKDWVKIVALHEQKRGLSAPPWAVMRVKLRSESPRESATVLTQALRVGGSKNKKTC